MTDFIQLIEHTAPITAIAIYLVYVQTTTMKALVKQMSEMTGAIHALRREVEHMRGKRIENDADRK